MQRACRAILSRSGAGALDAGDGSDDDNPATMRLERHLLYLDGLVQHLSADTRQTRQGGRTGNK
eukprot:14724593-Alexandrium_andersonii.AAC.1